MNIKSLTKLSAILLSLSLVLCAIAAETPETIVAHITYDGRDHNDNVQKGLTVDLINQHVTYNPYIGTWTPKRPSDHVANEIGVYYTTVSKTEISNLTGKPLLESHRLSFLLSELASFQRTGDGYIFEKRDGTKVIIRCPGAERQTLIEIGQKGETNITHIQNFDFGCILNNFSIGDIIGQSQSGSGTQSEVRVQFSLIESMTFTILTNRVEQTPKRDRLKPAR